MCTACYTLSYNAYWSSWSIRTVGVTWYQRGLNILFRSFNFEIIWLLTTELFLGLFYSRLNDIEAKYYNIVWTQTKRCFREKNALLNLSYQQVWIFVKSIISHISLPCSLILNNKNKNNGDHINVHEDLSIKFVRELGFNKLETPNIESIAKKCHLFVRRTFLLSL